MDRNRIRYFIIAAAFMVVGYLARAVDEPIFHRLSFVLICIGSYLLFSIWFRKAAAWVLIIINIFVQGGLQVMTLFDLKIYNYIYNTQIGGFILGAPFDKMMFIYIVLGTLGGAALELALRPFNKIGMG